MQPLNNVSETRDYQNESCLNKNQFNKTIFDENGRYKLEQRKTNHSRTRKIAWAFLMLAILFEVCGVAMLNAVPLWLSPISVDGIVRFGEFSIKTIIVAKVVLLCMISISYYCMSLALRKISLGVAYSVWEIVGMIGILLISFIFFPPHLTIKEYAGIAIGFIGIVCVIAGEEH